jgi:hypothetical protein
MKSKNKLLFARIEELDVALKWNRQCAIKAGLRQDVFNNGKFTAECVRLTEEIERLMLQINLTKTEMLRDYDNITKR